MQLHSGQYRYHCDICRKGFNVNTNYDLHMRSHEGLRYYCQYCGKSFGSKQNHDYHVSVHTGYTGSDVTVAMKDLITNGITLYML